MLKKHAGKIFLIVSVILIGGSYVISNQATKNADVGVEITDHVKGNPDATVVVREYADFQCPACGQAHPIVNEFIAEYGDQVRFEFYHFPLVNIHPFAVPAAKAAEAAGQQGKFFQMHDKLFDNQQAWSAAANPMAFFIQYAEELELDVEQFRTHMRSNLIDQAIQASFEAAREKGYTGTPTFELNGEQMQYGTFEEWREQIVAAIGGGDSASSTDAAVPAITGPDVKFGI